MAGRNTRCGAVAVAVGLLAAAGAAQEAGSRRSGLSVQNVAGGGSQPAAEPGGIPEAWRQTRNEKEAAARERLEGKAAPSLAGLSQWMNTDARSWKDLEGKVVLLDYWATWCGPCIAGIPHLKEMQKKYEDEGLVILGVHSSRGWGEMAAFAGRDKLPYALAADADRSLGEKLGLSFIPSYFFIDREGVLRVAFADRSKLDQIAERLLAEKPAGTGDREGASSAGDGWPAHAEKELYAKDFRGKRAPGLVVEEWLGEKPETRQKVMLVDFWATWCGPCRKAIPELAALQEEFAEDLVVIGISDEPAETVRAFMEQNEMGYAQAIDTKARMKERLGVKGIPHVMIVSSDGRVRWQGYPLDKNDPLTADVVRQIIENDKGVERRRMREGG